MNQVTVFDAFGLDQLRRIERPPEPLGARDVRLRVASVSLNYRDYMMVCGTYNRRLPLPLIPCSDGSGTVLEVGAEVTHLREGDRVVTTMIPDWEDGLPGPKFLETTLGGPLDGMMAEQRVLPAHALFPLPNGMSLEQGCCLPVAGLTAWNALHAAGPLGPGSKVLLLGTGGVSIAALGIARALGAEVAITSSSERKLARAEALGANHLINYRLHERWEKQVREIWPDGADLVLEVGGDGTFDQSVRAVRNGGTIALIGVLAQQNKPVNLTTMLMRGIRAQGIIVGSRRSYREYLDFVSQHQLEQVIDLIYEGQISLRPALEHLASGAHFGKLVIRLGA